MQEAANRLEKVKFEEDLVLESQTFKELLKQAEQMAEDYADLKEKYASSQMKYKELCAKHEADYKEAIVQERKRIELIIEQLGTAIITEQGKSESKLEIETEIDKHYQNIIQANKDQITKLEGDLAQAEKLIETLKNDKKNVVNGPDKSIDDIVKNGLKDSEKVKKLAELLQQKTNDLTNEKAMQEMWISELEVASKAYDTEKTRNKTISQKVLLYTIIVGGTK